MSQKKEKTEVYATSILERKVTLSLEKPQAMMAKHFTKINKILYFIATILPLPNVGIEQEVKDAMIKFVDATWDEVEGYYAEVEDEYNNKYREKMLPLDGYTSLKSSAEREFSLSVNCPAISRFINLIVRYDELLKKIDYYWLSGYMDDVTRLQTAKLLDNKLYKLITNISIINKALITKKYCSLGFGGKDELTRDEIRALNDTEINKSDEESAA